MGIRLNKVLTELNIGLQTAVDFLKNKTSLGEVRDDATPNTKISDKQYEALVEAFSTDKAVKTQADKLFPKKPKEKRTVSTDSQSDSGPVKTKTEEDMQHRQQFKPLGKIDLGSIGKPKPAQQPAPSQEEKKKEPVAPAVSQVQKPAEKAPKAKVEQKPVVEAPKAEASKPVEPKPEKKQKAPKTEVAEVKSAETKAELEEDLKETKEAVIAENETRVAAGESSVIFELDPVQDTEKEITDDSMTSAVHKPESGVTDFLSVLWKVLAVLGVLGIAGGAAYMIYQRKHEI